MLKFLLILLAIFLSGFGVFCFYTAGLIWHSVIKNDIRIEKKIKFQDFRIEEGDIKTRAHWIFNNKLDSCSIELPAKPSQQPQQHPQSHRK